jgi:hypothetical protein
MKHQYSKTDELPLPPLLSPIRKDLMCDTDIQGAERNTRAILEVLEYRLFVDMEDLNAWVNQAVEQFPIECF